jgi:small GTP-binding protein
MGKKKERSRNVLKTAILGDGGVGKTTFTRRCVEGIFDPKTKITVGIEFHLLRTKIIDPLSDADDPPLIDVEVQIWDFGGEDRFRFMLPRYCQGAVGGLLLYDSSRFSTTRDLPEWLEIWRNNTPPNAPIFLVGTKKDLLKEEEIEDVIKAGNKLAGDLRLPSFDLISSKTKEKVDLVLNKLITEAYKFNAELIEKESKGE